MITEGWALHPTQHTRPSACPYQLHPLQSGILGPWPPSTGVHSDTSCHHSLEMDCYSSNRHGVRFLTWTGKRSCHGRNESDIHLPPLHVVAPSSGSMAKNTLSAAFEVPCWFQTAYFVHVVCSRKKLHPAS